MRMELHDKGLVLSAPEIPGEPSEAVRRASGGSRYGTRRLLRYNGFANNCV